MICLPILTRWTVSHDQVVCGFKMPIIFYYTKTPSVNYFNMQAYYFIYCLTKMLLRIKKIQQPKTTYLTITIMSNERKLRFEFTDNIIRVL